MNYIYKYNSKIQNGEIITSKKVKAVYNALTQDLKSKKKGTELNYTLGGKDNEYEQREIRQEKYVKISYS